MTAFKVALADRFLDLVWQLADEGALRNFTFDMKQGPVSDSTATGPLSESQETTL